MKANPSWRDFLFGMVPKGSVCAEVGVHKGHFSRRIFYHVEPKRLHLIDPWKFEPGADYSDSFYGDRKGKSQENMNARYNKVKSWFRPEITKGQVVIHRGYSHQVCRGFADEYFDWVYIDGNHLYEFVKMDLNFFYGKVKAGGLIMGDDYETDGWWRRGVKKAVDEFVKSCPVETVLIRDNQYVLRKVGR
jgi:hypothetical protein